MFNLSKEQFEKDFFNLSKELKKASSYKWGSQYGETGIIVYLLEYLDIKPKYCLEFGAGMVHSGRKHKGTANIRYLYDKYESKCLYFDTNKKVIDIGSGTGETASGIARLGAKLVVGIDYSENAINIANTRHTESNLEFKVGTFEDLVLDNLNSFDEVL